ncbi:MAG: AHH domain-containing protein [Pseudomonadota bacterium]
MPIPEKITLYHEKSLLDRTIDNVAAQEAPLSTSDFNKLGVAAQIQEGIDRYRAQAADLSSQALNEEDHKPARLAAHLEQAGKIRPQRCHPHAIVAGKHKYAAMVRVFMSRLKIRIDDSDNGMWLPENTAATPHPAFPSAPPHSRIHRYNYYFWVHSHLSELPGENVFRARLQLISRQLHQGSFPSYVMLPKGIGLHRGIFK